MQPCHSLEMTPESPGLKHNRTDPRLWDGGAAVAADRHQYDMQSSFAGSYCNHGCWVTTTILGVCSQSDSCHVAYDLQQGHWSCSKTGWTMQRTDRLTTFGHRICMGLSAASNHDSLPDCRVRVHSTGLAADGPEATCRCAACNRSDLIRQSRTSIKSFHYALRHAHNNQG